MRKYLPSLGLFFTLLIMWEIIVRVGHIEKFILPAPSRIGLSLVETSALLLEHSLRTMQEATLGFILAVSLGSGLAIIMGLAPGMRKALYPLVVISQTIPIIAIAPLLVIWFGFGIMPKVMVVALICFFPITVSLVEGLEAVDADMVRLLLGMGATPWQIFKTVRFPGAMPSFFAGLKISATYSIMGAVIGEWLVASKGLGVYMTRSMNSFLTERVFAAIVVISALSLLLFGLIEVCGRLLMPWNYQKMPWKESWNMRSVTK